MPQLNAQLISVVENALMTQARLQKRGDESEAQTFARVYEGSLAYRQSWQAVTEAKHLLALQTTKGMATLTPTS